MRSLFGSVLSFLTLLLISSPVQAQIDAQSSIVLASSLRALGGVDLQDLTLTGIANRNPSSNQESLSTTIKIMASGASQTTSQTATGVSVETRIVDKNGLWAGSWSDPTGTRRAIAAHNMMTEPTWFFPELAVRRAIRQDNSTQVSYIGKEILQSTSVEHLRFIGNPSASLQLQARSQTDIYLNAASLLPVMMTYNIHPDNNVLVDIPVTVLYTSYAQLGGVMLPTHVQQLRNNAPFVDLQIQAVQVNTGVSVALPQ